MRGEEVLSLRMRLAQSRLPRTVQRLPQLNQAAETEETGKGSILRSLRF